VFAKVSGLYPADPSWTAADVRDAVEFAVELFGPDRLMFGSDWPVAELGGGYAKVTAGLFKLIGQLHRRAGTPSWAAPPGASTRSAPRTWPPPALPRKIR
jgi:hypothetical protein